MSSSTEIHRALQVCLEDLREAGLEVLPRPALQAATGPAAAGGPPLVAQEVETERPSGQVSAHLVTPPAAAATNRGQEGALFAMDQPEEVTGLAEEEKSAAPTLAVLADEVAACTQCEELASSRKQTVFADGSSESRLLFLGEAPGADEDAQGVPFVGRAGKLLTDMIERGMKLPRSEVYIMNILKCRPPGNRNPLPHEARNCRRYLLRQIELVNPEFICCLGAVAAQNLLESTQSIGKLRGRFHDWRGIQVLCTYHPAYLLRNPDAKRPTWEDLQMLMKAMELE